MLVLADLVESHILSGQRAMLYSLCNFGLIETCFTLLVVIVSDTNCDVPLYRESFTLSFSNYSSFNTVIKSSQCSNCYSKLENFALLYFIYRTINFLMCHNTNIRLECKNNYSVKLISWHRISKSIPIYYSFKISHMASYPLLLSVCSN